MNCDNCQHDLRVHRASIDAPHPFPDSGLARLAIAGVDVYRCDRCDDETVTIPQLGRLLAAVARWLLFKPVLLLGQEVRYLRKYNGMNAREFARRIRVDPAHLSRLENEHYTSLGPPTDQLARLVSSAAFPAELTREILSASVERAESGRDDVLVFVFVTDRWVAASDCRAGQDCPDRADAHSFDEALDAIRKSESQCREDNAARLREGLAEEIRMLSDRNDRRPRLRESLCRVVRAFPDGGSPTRLLVGLADDDAWPGWAVDCLPGLPVVEFLAAARSMRVLAWWPTKITLPHAEKLRTFCSERIVEFEVDLDDLSLFFEIAGKLEHVREEHRLASERSMSGRVADEIARLELAHPELTQLRSSRIVMLQDLNVGYSGSVH